MTTQATTEARTSVCESCGRPIAISIVVGRQRWHDVEWKHLDPEMIGFAPARDEFVCSRCGHTQTERPKD